tara:strand:- start:4766 stop:5089 length:324 start_codon:yes stop_codon:yes gene_type:complete
MGLEKYLHKSKDTLEDFKDSPGIFVNLDEEALEWLDYKVYGDIFWIRTIMVNPSNRTEALRIWDKIKDFAINKGCNKIQFTTKRDGRAWERLFNDMKVVQWKLEIKL